MKKNVLKIAMIAPAFGETGGPEVAVKNLVDALLEKGVDVTLFAPADWHTKAKHVPTIPKSLWNMRDFKDQTDQMRKNLILENLLTVMDYQQKFDIIHLHSYRYAASVGCLLSKPCLLTYHSKIIPLEFKQIKKTVSFIVALSERHGNKMPVSAIIENGIPTKNISYSFKRGGYLVAAGRILNQKGFDVAIDIAKEANKKLLIIGRIGVAKERVAYFNEYIKPRLSNKIIHINEVSQSKFFTYLKNAEAFLFPYKNSTGSLSVCPLIVMEALACGTPVIGTNINPLPEPLKDSSVACISNNFAVWVKAAKSTEKFDRKKCRKFAEKYFDSSVMADKYIRLYKKILRRKKNLPSGLLDKKSRP
jgi:glycosyltransferase involved in cell wall biosynthesis